MSFTADVADMLKKDDKSDLTSSARSALKALESGGKTAGAVAAQLEWPLDRAVAALTVLLDAGLIRTRQSNRQQLWFIPTVTVVPDAAAPEPARISRAAQRDLMATRYAALAMANELVPNALTQTKLAVALWLLGEARLDPKA